MLRNIYRKNTKQDKIRLKFQYTGQIKVSHAKRLQKKVTCSLKKVFFRNSQDILFGAVRPK